MASSGKKKTTFAKMNRENKLREKRLQKQARKDARARGELVAVEAEPATAPQFDDLPAIDDIDPSGVGR